MSAFGTKRTFKRPTPTSGFGVKPDIMVLDWHTKTTICLDTARLHTARGVKSVFVTIEQELMRFALLLAAAVILIRDPTGKWVGDPLRPWFESLRNKAGLYCCAEADGHPLDDGEWDIKNNNYRVFLQGEWTVVPDEAVILGPNKVGKAIVWVWPTDALRWGGGGSNPIKCFIPGSGV